MKPIYIFPPDAESQRRTGELNRNAEQFEREMLEARATYIERNGITPEEEYKMNLYPYHSFIDYD